MDEPLMIEIVYAGPRGAIVRRASLDSSSTVGDALRLAAADPDFAEVDFANCAAGIFGRLARREQPLESGDRIEIYRPLLVDPKSARRARARESALGNGGSAGGKAPSRSARS
jgi:putative ubiquitin-RnfH superfamily antitoxin RatB of RatAB toxin-antitoxin module